ALALEVLPAPVERVGDGRGGRAQHAPGRAALAHGLAQRLHPLADPAGGVLGGPPRRRHGAAARVGQVGGVLFGLVHRLAGHVLGLIDSLAGHVRGLLESTLTLFLDVRSAWVRHRCSPSKRGGSGVTGFDRRRTPVCRGTAPRQTAGVYATAAPVLCRFVFPEEVEREGSGAEESTCPLPRSEPPHPALRA